jgi:hypothetical protein
MNVQIPSQRIQRSMPAWERASFAIDWILGKHCSMHYDKVNARHGRLRTFPLRVL